MSVLEKFLAEEELATNLKYTTRTLRSWRDRQIGPPWVKIGNKAFYPIDEIEPWLRSRIQRPQRARS
jgi:hypothetical protein